MQASVLVGSLVGERLLVRRRLPLDRLIDAYKIKKNGGLYER